MASLQQIAFVCHPYHRGGVTSWMRDAAIAYAAAGVKVYFVTVDPIKPFHSGKDREKMITWLQAGSKAVNIITASAGFTFEFGSEEYRASVYRDLIKKHVPSGTPLIVSDDESVWKGVASITDIYPMVGVLHGDQDHYYNKALRHQQQLSICACVSNRIKRKAVDRCTKLDAARFYTIPCGIDLPAFAPVNEQPGVYKLIFIGRIADPDKRAGDLVKICATLREQNKLFHLDIVGSDETSAPEYVTMFREAGVSDFVTFHGWRTKSEIHKLLGRSNVLLLTSNSEGMPLVMMEALGAGCGFTGTRVSGIEDYEHTPLAANCFGVYTIGDIHAAISQIGRLMAVPPNVRSKAARKLAESEFSMQVCLDKYTDAIHTSGQRSVKPFPLSLSSGQVLQSKLIATARHLKSKFL